MARIIREKLLRQAALSYYRPYKWIPTINERVPVFLSLFTGGAIFAIIFDFLGSKYAAGACAALFCFTPLFLCAVLGAMDKILTVGSLKRVMEEMRSMGRPYSDLGELISHMDKLDLL